MNCNPPHIKVTVSMCVFYLSLQISHGIYVCFVSRFISKSPYLISHGIYVCFISRFISTSPYLYVCMLTNSVLYLIVGPVRHRMLHVVDVAVTQRVVVDVDSPVPAH